MASEEIKMKCFTYIWKLENASYCYPNENDCIESPTFTVDEIHETKWRLDFYPFRSVDAYCIGLFLQRQDGEEEEETVEIDCEIALLLSDGTVIYSWMGTDEEIEREGYIGTWSYAKRNEVFFGRKSVLFPRDTLTVRCRIWKSIGELSRDVQCFARTRVAVEKRSFLWTIKDFSTLVDNEKQTCEIKSLSSGEQLMSLDIFLRNRMICDEIIYLKAHPNFKKIKCCTLRLSIIDAYKNVLKCFQNEYWHEDCCENKDFPINYTKKDLLEQKNLYLPNDELSLWCECAFSCGIELEEIERVICDSIAFEKNEVESKENDLPVPIGILTEDFKSMLNDSSLYDIKLRASSKTYPAHKCILSARSPVFKAMFSTDMKEKVKDFVDIEDLSGDTVFRMLRYIYSADVGKLEWTSATELYEAGDKYQILNLKDICSSYLKRNLCPNNACEALILADLHQDEHLKGFVQDFILSHEEDIINSKEWERLAETNLKLAYETTLLKFKK